MTKGAIYNVSRFRIHTDGEGFTTLVGMFYCSLSCKYCLNKHYGFHSIHVHHIEVDELIKSLSIDDLFFRMSGGGITFGGHEPLLQEDFLIEFCQKKPSYWKINIQTSLNVDIKHFDKLISFVDHWIVDIKDINPHIYSHYTNQPNHNMLQNLDYLLCHCDHQKVTIRIPLIPNYNTDDDRIQSMEYLTLLYGDDIHYDLFTYHT